MKPSHVRGRRRAAAAGFVGVVLGCCPLLPAHGDAATNGPAVFAAEAEAWAYSVEVGIPGPVGPLASHTTAAIDNSPHATAAAGLADPGYLVRATAGLVAGIPTPAYCESAWPEGPNRADCGASAVGHGAGQSNTDSADGPNATATAALGRVTPSDAAGALTIAAQSTTSSAFADKDGTVKAQADAVLHGVTIAGGAVHLGTMTVHRDATASGAAAPKTSTSIALGGVTVAGAPVNPMGDQVKSLADAAGKAFGNTLTIEPLGAHVASAGGKVAADTAGLRIRFVPAPDKAVQIVLGYSRVLVYGAGAPAAAAASGGPLAGESTTAAGSSTPASAVAHEAVDQNATSAPPTGPSATPSSDAAAAPSSAASPPRHLLAVPRGTPVRWVSPFVVLAQMTSGSQAWWFLLGLVPLLASAWLTRRGGMGVLAPWAAKRQTS